MIVNSHKNKRLFGLLAGILLTGMYTGSAFAQLSGIKTINPSGGNYSTITAAVNDLAAQGVSGPVVFNISNGTYTEQVNIPDIAGVSAVNTITFQSLSGDSSLVVLSFNSTAAASNYTLRLNNPDYITVRKITVQALGTIYGRAIELEGTVTNISIENCRLLGSTTSSGYADLALLYCYRDPASQISIKNNFFSGGNYGIYYEGLNTTTLSLGTVILNNKFSEQRYCGIYLEAHDAPIVNSNTIQLRPTDGYGIYLMYCDNSLQVQKNNIIMTNGTYGIDLQYCDGNSLNRGLVANNSVSITGGASATGIYLYGTSYQKIYHNSVNITARTSNDFGAFYLNLGSNIDLRNNIFANAGENYAINVKTPSALEFSDYNDYYSNGNFLGFWGSAVQDLDALKALQAPLKDANSISFNPVFASATDLHAGSFRIDNKGINLGVSTDIDGQVRTAYDIGADEFTGSGSALAAGTYTIGGTSPTYTTFSLAAAALTNYGISGNVTFNVRNGSYNEQFTLGPIAGTSVSSNVIFQAESGDSTLVELSFANGVNNNYLVRFNGADYVTFRKLSLTSLGTSYSRVFWFDGSSLDNTITSCVLNGEKNSASYDALIYSYESNVNNLLISNNYISGTRYGIYMSPNNLSKTTGTRIQGNNILSQKTGSPISIYLRYHDAPKVLNNTITNTSFANFYGIYLQDCVNDLQVIGNRINSGNSDGGILLYTCKSINTKRGLTANNFVDIGGVSNAYGIYTYGSEYQNIYYNTVRITTTNLPGGRAFFNGANSNNINLRNNLFTNFGGGYAFYSEGTTVGFTSDYNGIYSTGNYPVFWNSVNHTSLGSYKTAASPQDANTVWANPVFLSGTDLHASSSFVNNKAVAITEVTTDIDGQSRNLSTPDLGADEFSSVSLPLAAGTYTIGGSAPSYASFSLAVGDLNTRGIAGPVVFNVRDGSYNEQFVLNDINGSSLINTVTFQSESGDSSLVDLNFSANISKPYIVQLNGTDYISFRKISFSSLNTAYSLVFDLKGGIQKLSLQNCQLLGNGSTGNEYYTSIVYSENGTFTDLLIENCLLTGGRSGVWMESLANSQSVGTRILNTKFIGQNYNSVYLKYHDAPLVEKNIVNNTTAYAYFKAIDLEYCNNDLKVSGNYLLLPGGGTGVFLSYCAANTSKRGLIANNIADIAGAYIGYGINTENSDFQRIYFNSVRITGSDVTNGKAYYNVAGTNQDVRNNIFSNFGGGYAYYTNSVTAIVTSDNNNLFTTGNFLAYWNANTFDLTGFKALSSRDAGSISVNPVFGASLNTGSSFLNNAGTPLAAVSKDFDGDIRSAGTPDIGADEFTPVQVPLIGTYTIGGSSPSFASFSLAAEALNERGVSGPVLFNVRNGIYDDRFILYEVSGSSAINTIVFQSESGDSAAVSLTYNSLAANSNYVIYLFGTDYLTIKNITIAGVNPANSQLLVLKGNVSHLNLLNNVFSVNINAPNSSIGAIEGYIQNSISIRNNLFLAGGYGINIDNAVSNPSTGFECTGNIFKGQQTFAIRLEDIDSPVISGNTISTNQYNNTAIYVYNCDNKIRITENRIQTETYSTGISVNYCNGTFVNQGLIANNFVNIGGNSYATGINISNSQYLNILYNSVSITSTYSSTSGKNAFYLSGGDNNTIRNNIFYSETAGYAYYINTPASVVSSDFNDYYSATDIAYWGGVKATLSALRLANSMDAGSISANPLFVSANDLRVKQALLYKAANPNTLVSTDIFGNVRDGVKTDIGAVEFYCTTPVIDLTTSASCFGDSTIFSYNISKVAVGSNFSIDFDNDFNPDATFSGEIGEIRYLYPTIGAKTVNLIVSQIAGCNDYISKNVTIATSPVLEILATGASCNESNGSAIANVTGGTGPYSYSWSNGNKTSEIGSLAKGNYSVTVKNENNCISTGNFEIGDRIVVTTTALAPASCAKSNGSASAIASGGTGPYTYVWSNGETETTATKLTTGANFVSVTDATGCTSVGSVNILTDASGPKIALKTVTHNKCYGEKSGALDVTLSGGTGPYTILWSNGSVSEDQTGLASGIYDILISDNTGCEATATFGIEQPLFINVSTVIEDASCNGSNGKAIALVGGGAKPYKYEWSGGNSGPVAEGLSAGIYSLTLTDNNNCSVVTPVIINNTGGPKVSLNNLKGVSCSNAATGAIDIQISGGTPLYSYAWLPGGQSSQDIISITEGNYEVTVTDNAGCKGSGSFTVGIEAPAVNPICLVTVDSLTGKNLVVWEKLSQPDVISFNIYRESSSKGIFQLIASQPSSETGEYLDEVADPSLRSWRYRISAVDNCGNESELSEAHKTIHLTQNVGLNRTVNLIWDKYEGFPTSTYKIQRYSKTEGWRALAALPGDLNSFTDDKALLDEGLFYEIEIENPNGGCTTLKASTHNTSRSNRQTTTVSSSLGVPLVNLQSLAVYPNPASTEFTLELQKERLKKIAVEIIDGKGRIIGNYQYPAQSDKFSTTIEINGINEGVYILRISTDDSVNYRKLVVKP
jgi:parallel beta-helix repeat protein